MPMSGRDRQLAAISHTLADRLPVDAICVENQADIARLLDIPTDAVLDRLGLDGRIISAPYTGEAPVLPTGQPLTEWRVPLVDDYGTARAYPLATAESLAEIERFPWPSPDDYDYALAAEAAHALNPRYAVRGPYWVPLICRVFDLVGMEQAMVWMTAEPALFEAVLERATTFTEVFCERLLTACGDAMPFLCLGDDFATQRGLMVSPALWRRWLKPRLARVFAVGKRLGKHVWFHSCGDITAVLPDLLDIGMDVWETVQLHALPLSASDLKREYGAHLTFFGGVNTQRLPFVTPEQVRAEVRACIEVLGRDGGYICGPDHHIKPDVPAANAVALFDDARAYRGTGYTL
ncbi:MAG: hypothetical protein GX557_00965 [Chloroflexi bacterium]|nr:hypothetical protein [Chloroflexota bacterium]